MGEPSWLFAKHPIVVNPDLAVGIGLNEAIVVQQLNYWLNSKNAKNIDGRKWIYNTYENWQKDNFPFWSIPTIKRTMSSLEKSGIVLASNFNKAGFDKTKWYSIDEVKLNKLMIRRSDQNDTTSGSKRSDGTDQNDPTNTRDYTDNTTETTNNNNTEGHQADPQDNKPSKTKKKKSESLLAKTVEVIEYLNKKTGRSFRTTTETNRKPIRNRLKEGFTVDDCKKVIDKKYAEWHGVEFSNGNMGDNYLTPGTLFRAKNFERYLNESSKVDIERKARKEKDGFDIDQMAAETASQMAEFDDSDLPF